MPSDKTDVYVDLTFTSSEPGTEDTSIEYQIVDGNNIGGYTVPVVYRIDPAVPVTIDKDISFETTASISGALSILHQITFDDGYDLGVIDSLVNYRTGTSTISGSRYLPVNYSTGHAATSGTLNKIVNFTSGKQYEYFYDMLVELVKSTAISGTLIHALQYTNFSGNYTPANDPIPTVSGFTEKPIILYRTGSTTSGSLDVYMDISFAGWVPSDVLADVFCTLEKADSYLNTDMTTISGGMYGIYSDVLCTSGTQTYLIADVFCALTDYASITVEAAVISGSIGFLESELTSADVIRTAVSCDVELNTIYIFDFYPAIGEYETAGGVVCVSVTDSYYGISTSGTYFMVDGVQVSSTLSGIADGYRICYDPVDDFESFDGTTTLTMHAQNNDGAVLEKDFYLTFGYIVEYENYPYGGMDYGFNNPVVVRMSAENMASCPRTTADGYWFVTKRRKNTDLSASIVGKPFDSNYKDLPAIIFSESTAYFYGKDFEVVFNAKDFAGNEMSELVFNFTIEDKP